MSLITNYDDHYRLTNNQGTSSSSEAVSIQKCENNNFMLMPKLQHCSAKMIQNCLCYQSFIKDIKKTQTIVLIILDIGIYASLFSNLKVSLGVTLYFPLVLPVKSLVICCKYNLLLVTNLNVVLYKTIHYSLQNSVVGLSKIHLLLIKIMNFPTLYS